MPLTDTIIALSSTPGGPAPRAILRLSGPNAHALAQSILSLPPNAARGYFPNLSIATLPQNNFAAALLFQSPRSYTGEHLAELHIPNSPALIRSLTQKILAASTLAAPVRMAEPGEFSARAFFNGKLDLTQAEGVAATIHAHSEVELRAAASLCNGDLHQWTHATADRLANLLALIEAGIDFVEEEDIHFIDSEQLASQLAELTADIRRQLDSAIRIDRLDSPPTVVFIGQPNVGKSSLLNALVGQDRSIVSPTAGTTRDTLAITTHFGHQEIRLLDVPGEEPPATELQQKMMTTRAAALLEADLIIEVLDATKVSSTPKPAVSDGAGRATLDNTKNPSIPTLTILNKSDLLQPLSTPNNLPPSSPLQVSAKTHHNLDLLKQSILHHLTRHEPTATNRLVLNHRHRALLQASLEPLQKTTDLLQTNTPEKHPELLATELRHALNLLGQITGAISPDEVLGRVFSQFCIGK